jgi:GMP synthase-like glutamine amidotransferase
MVKLCILQTGEIHPEMDPSIPRYEPLYRGLFSPFDDYDLSFYLVREGIFPDSIDDHDAFLITGSAAGTYEDHDWLDPLRALVREIHEATKPLVGICFGHQIIADALGGITGKSPKGWGLGLRHVTVCNAPDWMDEVSDGYDLLYVHQDQVNTVPKGATVIAGNSFCPIAAYTLGNHVLSIQGHPEFTAEVVRAMIDFRIDPIETDAGSEAKETLSLSPDNEKIGRAIVRFIEKSRQSSLPKI